MIRVIGVLLFSLLLLWLAGYLYYGHKKGEAETSLLQPPATPHIADRLPHARKPLPSV